jgi:hypothetical protein
MRRAKLYFIRRKAAREISRAMRKQMQATATEVVAEKPSQEVEAPAAKEQETTVE